MSSLYCRLVGPVLCWWILQPMRSQFMQSSSMASSRCVVLCVCCKLALCIYHSQSPTEPHNIVHSAVKASAVPIRLANSELWHSGTPSPPFPSLFPPLHPSLSQGPHPLNPLRGLGERCKLPQWCLGRSPSWQKIWCISEPQKNWNSLTLFLWCNSYKTNR